MRTRKPKQLRVRPFRMEDWGEIMKDSPQQVDLRPDSESGVERIAENGVARTLVDKIGRPLACAGLAAYSQGLEGRAFIWTYIKNGLSPHAWRLVSEARRLVQEHEARWPIVSGMAQTEEGARMLRLLGFQEITDGAHATGFDATLISQSHEMGHRFFQRTARHRVH